jgi:hypothetical protein
MTEHSATILIPDPTFARHLLARATTTAGLVSSPHVPDDLLNATEPKP